MARIACGLDDILEAAKAKLVADGVTTEAAAFLTVEADNVPPGPAEPPLMGLMFNAVDRRMDTLSVEEEGGDSVVTEMELIVALWTRVALDQAGQDDEALTNETLGIAGILRKAVNSLNARDLTDGDDTLTWRPVVFLGARNLGRWKKDENWRRFQMRFNVAFDWKVAD